LIGNMPLQIARDKIVGILYRIYEIVTRQGLNSLSGGTERIGLLTISLPWREGLGEQTIGLTNCDTPAGSQGSFSGFNSREIIGGELAC